ncbi:hypothetical protein LTR84_012313 [Exophiala bonariae]|uniref:Uncharacterized protein n=1 Tax=Exophiala bonariae TaxID=1690606 RepID=A0AAV9NKA2_9EURO|nr:hypothetical protein LTR84_012313 [Exophiala bonariae]
MAARRNLRGTAELVVDTIVDRAVDIERNYRPGVDLSMGIATYNAIPIATSTRALGEWVLPREKIYQHRWYIASLWGGRSANIMGTAIHTDFFASLFSSIDVHNYSHVHYTLQFQARERERTKQ